MGTAHVLRVIGPNVELARPRTIPYVGHEVIETAQHSPASFTGTIHIPLATNPLSLNGRMHWRKKAALTKQWRMFATFHAARYPVLPACDVTLTWYVTDNRRRDEDNLFGLLKVLADGLVDAGVVADDTHHYMGKQCRIQRAPEGTSTAYMELHVRSR